VNTASPSLHARFAAALLDPAAACPRELRAWNGSDVERRFAVYRNNVLAAWVDALADTFPVVQELVGGTFFRAMAAAYGRAAPPRSPLLVAHGEGLPDFIAGFTPAAALPWLADVARLELARTQAFHAADAEPVAPDAITRALSCGDGIGGLRLRPHPSLHVLASPHPVFSVWAAHQGQGALEEIDLSRGESVLVLRPRLDVLVVPCGQATARFAVAMLGGGSFAECAEAAGRDADLPDVLGALLRHGAVAGIVPPPGDPA
jgi:hypothetical protein